MGLSVADKPYCWHLHDDPRCRENAPFSGQLSAECAGCADHAVGDNLLGLLSDYCSLRLRVATLWASRAQLACMWRSLLAHAVMFAWPNGLAQYFKSCQHAFICKGCWANLFRVGALVGGWFGCMRFKDRDEWGVERSLQCVA